MRGEEGRGVFRRHSFIFSPRVLFRCFDPGIIAVPRVGQAFERRRSRGPGAGCVTLTNTQNGRNILNPDALGRNVAGGQPVLSSPSTRDLKLAAQTEHVASTACRAWPLCRPPCHAHLRARRPEFLLLGIKFRDFCPLTLFFSVSFHYFSCSTLPSRPRPCPRPFLP